MRQVMAFTPLMGLRHSSAPWRSRAKSGIGKPSISTERDSKQVYTQLGDFSGKSKATR